MPQALAGVVIAVAGAIGGAVTAIASVIPGVSGLAALSAGHAVGTFVASLGFTNGLLSGFSALALTASLASAISGPPHPKVGDANGGSQIDFKADPSAPMPYAVGRTATAGNILYRTTAGPKNVLQPILTTLSWCGPIEGFEKFSVEGITLTISRSDPTGDLAVAGVDVNGNPDNRYSDGRDLLWEREQLGDCPSAPFWPPAIEPTDFTSWSDDHKLSGHAATWMVLAYDQKAFPTGTPAPLWVIKGVKGYDPRLDSTYPGGSGSCRAADRSTWVWSENPFINGLTWCLGHYYSGRKMMGVGAPVANIDLSAFVEGANVCDANEWTCGGVVYSSDDKWDVLAAMLQAGSGKPMRLGAIISCFVDTPRVSLFTLTGADVVGEAVIPAGRARRDRINAVALRYRSEDHAWEMVDATPVVVDDYVTFDGRQRTKAVTYALVQDVDQAAELAAYDIVNSREFGPISLPCKPYWYGLKPGDAGVIDEPEFGLNGQKVIVTSRDPDPVTGVVTMQFRTETDAKHDFALGRTTTPPPTPGLTGLDPGFVPTPTVEAGWAIIDNKIETEDGGTIPAIIIAGAADDASASGVIVDYKVEASDSYATVEYPASVTRIEIGPLQPLTLYRAKIRYRNARGVEDTSAARDLGTVTTAAFVAGNTLNVGDHTTQVVLTAIANAEAAIAALQTAVAEANAVIAAAEDRGSAAAEGLAEAVIQRAVDQRNTKLATDAQIYIGAQPIGSYVINQKERTDTLVEFTDLIGVRSEDGGSILLNGGLVMVSPTETLAHYLTILRSDLDGVSSDLTTNYVTSASLTSTMASFGTSLTSTFDAAIATATQDLVTEADVDHAISVASTALTSSFGDALSSALLTYMTSSDVTQAIGQAKTAIRTDYEGYVATATSSLLTVSNFNSALSTYDTTVKAWVVNPAAPGNTLAASVSTTATALATATGQVYGSLTFKTNANSAIASMQLLSSSGATNLGAVVFDVDQFLVKSGSHPNITPLYFDATSGSLFSDTITVRTANIKEANIITAHLGNGAVTEFPTALNSNPNLTLTGSDQTVSGSVTCVIPSFNSGVQLMLYAEVSNAANVTGAAIIAIYRNGVTFVDQMAISMRADGLGGVESGSLPTADEPGGGTHVYTVVVKQTPAAGSVLARVQLRAIILKR